MIPVSLGRPRSDGGLTLFPLLYDDARSVGGGAPDGMAPNGVGGPPAANTWMLLADALADGTVEITEVGDGIVAELVATNRGPAPVLILDGEQLIGAKQHRITSRSILLSAGTKTRIPVSCMEQGRWAHRTRSMAHGGEQSPSSVRVHARRVEAEQARSSRRRGDGAGDRRRPASPSELLSFAQGEVWGSVAESSLRAGVHSETGALDAVYAGRRESMAARGERFAVEPGQLGVLAFVNGAPVGLDLLPGHAIYAKLHDRLVRAYLFEALDRGERREQGRTAVQDAEAFLAAATGAAREPLETVGLGRYAALVGTDIVGSELTVDGGLVHLAAFNVAR